MYSSNYLRKKTRKRKLDFNFCYIFYKLKSTNASSFPSFSISFLNSSVFHLSTANLFKILHKIIKNISTILIPRITSPQNSNQVGTYEICSIINIANFKKLKNQSKETQWYLESIQVWNYNFGLKTKVIFPYSYEYIIYMWSTVASERSRWMTLKHVFVLYKFDCI